MCVCLLCTSRYVCMYICKYVYVNNEPSILYVNLFEEVRNTFIYLHVCSMMGPAKIKYSKMQLIDVPSL